MPTENKKDAVTEEGSELHSDFDSDSHSTGEEVISLG